MADISIDRLSLRLQGISESDGRRLADLVAAGLAEADVSVRSDLRALRINVQAGSGSTMQGLSKQIVAELLGQLGREF